RLTLPEDLSKFDALREIIAKLRAPDGCPWDRKQTHLTLRESFLQECYEVLESLDEKDAKKLREELGDLLLHILLQAQIAQEAGEFNIDDVILGINEKLSYSQEIQDRVADVGFDWDNDRGVIEKLAEEVAEFKQAKSAAEKNEEFGDIMFTMANIARRQGIELEAACKKRGVKIGNLSFKEQNDLWDEAKKKAAKLKKTE